MVLDRRFRFALDHNFLRRRNHDAPARDIDDRHDRHRKRQQQRVAAARGIERARGAAAAE